MRVPIHRILLWSLIGSFILVAVIGIAAIVMPDLLPQSGRVLGSISLFGAFSLVGLACAAGLDRGRAALIMIVGLLACLIAFILWMIYIWQSPFQPIVGERTLGRIATIATITAIWASFIGAMVIRSPKRIAGRRLIQAGMGMASLVAGYFIFIIIADAGEWWIFRGIGSSFTLLGWVIWAGLIVQFQPKQIIGRRVWAAAAIVGSLLALYTIVFTWLIDEYSWLEEASFRIFGVLIILTATLSLISVCLSLIEKFRGKGAHETMPEQGSIEVAITCPRCRTALSLPRGRGRCTGCGLHISIEFEEPRCACGYLLHKLTSDTCPECGTKIPEKDRWPGAMVSGGTGSPGDVTPAGAVPDVQPSD